MATQTDPVSALAATVNRLYDLAGNASLNSTQQQQLLTQAHDLRGDLIAMVQMQLSASAAGYQDLVKNLSSVTKALDEAEESIKDLVDKVSGVADVAAAVDGLVQQAVQLAATAAKFTVA